MIRPVERFEVRLGGLEAPRRAPGAREQSGRSGPVGLLAAAALGAAAVLLIQRLIEDGRLASSAGALLRVVGG